MRACVMLTLFAANDFVKRVSDGILVITETARKRHTAGSLWNLSLYYASQKTWPLPVAEYSTLLMHSTQGKCYSISEHASLLRDCSFKPGDYHETIVDRGFMTAKISLAQASHF